MAEEYVAFDLETTGLSTKTDRIIEVGAVRFDATGRTISELEIKVDPGMPIPIAIQRLVGLTDADVRGGPAPQEAVAQLADFTEGAAMVAHGATFDLAYCAAVLPQAFARRDVFDTLELARVLMPRAASHSLPQMTVSLGIVHDRPHRALSDADATRALFIHLVALADALPATLLTRIRGLVLAAPAPLRDFFFGVARGEGNPAAAEIIGGTAPPPRPLRVPTAGGDLEADAVALLGPSGPLAGPGYEYREAQLEMARAVAQTIRRGGRLLVEAGTGVGKSYAYLAPLMLHAQRSAERAVVATHTITLQEQLVDRDVPAVNALLDEPVSVAMLKGRHHYISLRRWQRFLAAPNADIDVLRFKLKILVWLSETRTGDRGELRLAAGEDVLWQRVQSDSGDCLGSACANWKGARCFMVAARRGAAEADVVVTNHALLLADAERQGTVIDRYSALVVDEAHRLEESATRLLGSSLRAIDIADVLDRVSGAEGSALAVALDDAREATKRLFGDIKGLVASRLGNDTAANGTIAWTEEARAETMGQVVVRSAQHCIAALGDVATALTDAGGNGLNSSTLPQPERVDEEAQLAVVSVQDAIAVIDGVVLSPEEGFVSWLELRAEHAEIHRAPISVSGQLRNSVFDKAESTVLTSATLSVAGNFDFVRHRLGIGGGAETLALTSPFDYLSQAICVVPTGVPPYDDPHYDEVMARLIGDIARRLGGRTLALFTGYGPLRRIHGMLDRSLAADRIAVLGQGLDGTRRQVLESFLANPRTLLLGTSSFWEGIDIPGDSLRCVVIAKLPFAVPTDPLVRARSDSLSDPFRGYILPSAVLRLKQGFGRLIRRSDDRGAVVICDARLETRDYAQTFLEALPPAAVARLPEPDVGRAVAGFVERGELPSGAEPVAQGTAEGRQSLMGGAYEPHSEEPA